MKIQLRRRCIGVSDLTKVDGVPRDVRTFSIHILKTRRVKTIRKHAVWPNIRDTYCANGFCVIIKTHTGVSTIISIILFTLKLLSGERQFACGRLFSVYPEATQLRKMRFFHGITRFGREEIRNGPFSLESRSLTAGEQSAVRYNYYYYNTVKKRNAKTGYKRN